MKRQRLLSISSTVLPVLLVAGLLTGCAGRQQPSGNLDSGIDMTYASSEKKPLHYKTAFGFIETVKPAGGATGMDSTTTAEFSITTEEGSEGNQQLSITIDSMEATVSTMRNEMTRPVGEVIGKTYSMERTSRGKMTSFDESAEAKYRVGQFGFRRLETDFSDFFPILPDRPVKAGDSWTSTVEITDLRDATITYQLTSENTFNGLETRGDVECAKVTAEVTGTMKGEAQGPGTAITFEGTYEGSDIWCFDYKKGRLVSRDARGVVTGKAFDAMGLEGQGMDVPLSREISTVIELVR